MLEKLKALILNAFLLFTAHLCPFTGAKGLLISYPSFPSIQYARKCLRIVI